MAFGDLESGLWGVAWFPPSGPGAGVVGVGPEVQPRPLTLSGHEASALWKLEGEGIELDWEALSEAVWRDPTAPDQGFDQLCRVSGTIQPGQSASGLPCLGWRTTHVDPGQASSLRQVAAWFEPGDGFAVLALRPPKAKGQEQDVVAAAEFDQQHALRVEDPRLSTTYSSSGQATRAGVELWMEAAEDSEQLYARRAIGEATAPPVQWEVGDVALEAGPFRWYSGGREGPGVYVLGSRR
ncbi:MAG: hypothetical protein ACJ764_05000 [Solirubrobacteraceae bacterium]